MSGGTRFVTLEDMSFMAVVSDGAWPLDRTNNGAGNFRSYYTWGAAIALALNLSLRDRSAGRVSLDDFMRAMWRKYGKPGGPGEGLLPPRVLNAWTSYTFFANSWPPYLPGDDRLICTSSGDAGRSANVTSTCIQCYSGCGKLTRYSTGLCAKTGVTTPTKPAMTAVASLMP